jgi:hypothetical protein
MKNIVMKNDEHKNSSETEPMSVVFGGKCRINDARVTIKNRDDRYYIKLIITLTTEYERIAIKIPIPALVRMAVASPSLAASPAAVMSLYPPYTSTIKHTTANENRIY